MSSYETRCIHCRRVLVPKTAWDRLPGPDRQRLARTHARAHNSALCHRDYQRGMLHEADAYTGGWERRGMVLVPKQRVRVAPPIARPAASTLETITPEERERVVRFLRAERRRNRRRERTRAYKARYRSSVAAGRAAS